MQLYFSRVARWFIITHHYFFVEFNDKLHKYFCLMVTFPVNSDIPILIIFSKRHSRKKKLCFPNTKLRDVIMPMSYEPYCSPPIESLCFLVFVKSWSLNFSSHSEWQKYWQKWYFFLRGTFYTEKGPGVILYLVITMTRVNFFNGKYQALWGRKQKFLQVRIFSWISSMGSC